VVGLVDRPSGDALKIHTEPRPLTGGLAVMIATLSATALVGESPAGAVVAGLVLLLATGVTDDLVSLPPAARLVAELVAGGVMVAGGVTLSPLGAAGDAAFVLLVPVIANAVNVVDGQDGLAGSLAAVAAIGITAILASNGPVGALAPALVASLFAFLLWNRPPARVFLGDGGAYGVGGTLALLVASASPTWEALLGALVCLGVFCLELCSTVARRAVRRERLAGGDRNHVYDLLAEDLSSRTASTAVLVVAGLMLTVLGWVASRGPAPVALGISVATATVGAAAVVLLWRTRSSPPRHSR
jgi:UDP-GlcNAc:undecaprenyl-phosphate GlcNAc-1-phosphate transferase